ncbi:MAG TPA: ABC transporter permease [Vicinamibacterales bacterium]|nr:ABC transporter permease [Vicinamibacterales bacterium]
MKRAWAVSLKEMRQIARDRRTLLILLFIPAFFLFLYGYALNFDIRHVALAVQDRDDSIQSRELIARFTSSTYFDIAGVVTSDAELDAAMDRGFARAVLVIPEGFARRLQRGETAEVQIILDGDNANTATTVLGYATALLREASAALGGSVQPAFVAVESRVWYNPELRSTLFLVPGLISYISMITAVVSTALSIVREKESGTMEQVRMAPISTMAYVVGKTVPYLLLSQVTGLAVILASMGLFDLPMRGSWIDLSIVLAVFLVGALGTGVLISTVADTQQVAYQSAMLIAFLPSFILSGFIFPISSMPIALQYITMLVPARYFLTALRGVVLKGLDLPMLWQPLLALGLYAMVVLGLSAVRLARR